MERSRSTNSVLAIFSGFGSEIISKLLLFISRTIFINFLGAEYLGINGLFTNILTILSLADLGIGSAITFYLYKPIANKNKEKIKTLMQFYKHAYTLIGCAILILGLAFIPFLHYTVNLSTDLNVNLYVVYILFLLNTVISYLFFAYKSTIIFANQKQYLINVITVIFSIVSCIVESVVIIVFKDFTLSLVARLSVSMIKNLFISRQADKLYPYLKEKNVIKLKIDEIKRIFKDVYSIFLVKVGAVLATATDNLMISIMFGTVYTGFNSNYIMFTALATTLSQQVSGSFRAAVGNIVAEESKESQYSHFKNLDFINFWVASVFSVCLFQLLNPFITLWIGDSYLFSTVSVAFIVIHYFIANMLDVVFVFREGMGLFKYGRYANFFAGVVNIIIGIILGKIMGISGIFLATVITDICFSVYVFVHSLFKYGFEIEPITQFKVILKYFLVTIFTCIIVSIVTVWFNQKGSIILFLIRAIITFIIANIVLVLLYFRTSEFSYAVNKVILIIKKISENEKFKNSWLRIFIKHKK